MTVGLKVILSVCEGLAMTVLASVTVLKAVAAC